MYTPAHFAVTDTPMLHAVIRRHPLGLLITHHGGEMHTTHLPFLLNSESGTYGCLEAHLARANPHCEALLAGAASMVVFRGPDAYVSPRWYRDPSRNVPTWNYVAVHAHGTPRTVEEPQRSLQMISRLTDEHEAYFKNPWKVDEARDYADKLVSQVLAFELDISRLEGKFKLSQNRAPPDRKGVMQALAENHRDEAAEMLEMMQILYCDDGSHRTR